MIGSLSHHSVYQSSRWAKHRFDFGWTPYRLVARNSSGHITTAIQVLVKTALGKSVIAWSAGGPAGDISALDHSILLALREHLRSRFTYLRIACMRPTSVDADLNLKQNGFHHVSAPIGAQASLMLDLTADEPTRLDRCSSNWKRNLKRSTKHGSVPFVWKKPVAREIARPTSRKAKKRSKALLTVLVMISYLSGAMTQMVHPWQFVPLLCKVIRLGTLLQLQHQRVANTILLMPFFGTWRMSVQNEAYNALILEG